MTLCQPQNMAYCTEGSRKSLEANFSMVSMPSSLTSALSSCDKTELTHFNDIHQTCCLLYNNPWLTITCLRRHFLIFSTSSGSSFSANSTMVAMRLD